MADDADPLTDLVAASIQRVEEQRRDYAERSRRLNNFMLRTLTDQTGAIVRRERVDQVDFAALSDIIEGNATTPTEGLDHADRTEPEPDP